jgi:hypothetical protein
VRVDICMVRHWCHVFARYIGDVQIWACYLQSLDTSEGERCAIFLKIYM